MSILDKIISEQEEKAKEEFSPIETLNNLFLKCLSLKERDVLKRRFALEGGKEETLEEVGKEYNVTRERIRQIESKAVQRIIGNSEAPKILKPVEHFLIAFFTEFGGSMPADFLFSQIFGLRAVSEKEKRVLTFFLDKLLVNHFEAVKDSKEMRSGWQFKHFSTALFEGIKMELISVFEIEKKPLKLDNLFDLLTGREFFINNKERVNKKNIQSVLELYKIFSCNPFGEYGLSSWSQISPKRMHDRILMIMRKEGHPMHFREIAEKIEEIFKKKAHAPTVHNELILNKDYVLVGRGIYALIEWGYKKGVVAEVIEDVLKRENRPLTHNEIKEAVLKQRLVKENTIYLALMNKKRFKRLEDGRYFLVNINGV